MTANLRIGMLTPSSNTILEPMVGDILHGFPEVSAHYSRIRVTEISTEDRSTNQFDDSAFLQATALLADANVHVVGWNGTSASWLGFDRDRALCETITKRFDVPATTAVLAVNDLLGIIRAKRFALVTPYIDDIQNRIIANYREQGLECVAERHTNERVNFAFAEMSEEEIAEMIRAVSAERPDAVVIMCTNLEGARIADALERELDVPILDSVSAFVWGALRLGGFEPNRIQGWGQLFHWASTGRRDTG